MPEFEVAIYNKEVRDLVKVGERHKFLSDEWADIHYFEIEAENEEDAVHKIRAKYPESKGYVIEHVGPPLRQPD